MNLTCSSLGHALLHHVESTSDCGKILTKLALFLKEVIIFSDDLTKFLLKANHALKLLVTSGNRVSEG